MRQIQANMMADQIPSHQKNPSSQNKLSLWLLEEHKERTGECEVTQLPIYTLNVLQVLPPSPPPLRSLHAKETPPQ